MQVPSWGARSDWGYHFIALATKAEWCRRNLPPSESYNRRGRRRDCERGGDAPDGTLENADEDAEGGD